MIFNIGLSGNKFPAKEDRPCMGGERQECRAVFGESCPRPTGLRISCFLHATLMPGKFHINFRDGASET